MESVAKQKYKENIGEYIIYMYQMEDLIRAYDFDLEDINQYVISHYPVSSEEKSNILQWFTELAGQMKAEGLHQKGHLAQVQRHVDSLARLHWDLLKSDGVYFGLYQEAKPHILELVLEAGEESPGHEIQICINGIYGLLLSRLHGKTVPENILQGTKSFGKVLQYLNTMYSRANQGAD